MLATIDIDDIAQQIMEQLAAHERQIVILRAQLDLVAQIRAHVETQTRAPAPAAPDAAPALDAAGE
jgi:ribosome maturation protein Sdo1